jgi:hypothetical protein
MDRHDYDEDREDQVAEQIDLHTKAIHFDVFAGNPQTIRAVAERLTDLECGAMEAEALVRAAVVGHSALIGVRIASAVQTAIFFEAEARAERSVDAMERRRAESYDENRIAQAELARALH